MRIMNPRGLTVENYELKYGGAQWTEQRAFTLAFSLVSH